MSGQNNSLSVVIPVSVLCGGGTEAQTFQLARTLMGLNCMVEIVCFNEFYDDVVTAFREIGVTVTLLNIHDRRNKIGLLSKLYRLYCDRKPAMVHVQYTELGFIALAAAWAARVPLRFASVHQLGTNYGDKQRMIMRAASFLATSFLCVSKATEESWFGSSAVWDHMSQRTRRHWTFYNCIDTARIALASGQADCLAIRSRFKIGAGPVVGIIGRITEEKGHFVLLDAIAMLDDLAANITILAVGDENSKYAFLEKAAALGLKGNIVITGWLTSEEVFRLYGIMDIVVVPSFAEGFGLTAAEAMAAGLPVIASRVGGLAEIVKDGITGYLIEPHNPTRLAAALHILLNDTELAHKFGEEGRRRAANTFGTELYANKISKLYGLLPTK